MADQAAGGEFEQEQGAEATTELFSTEPEYDTVAEPEEEEEPAGTANVDTVKEEKMQGQEQYQNGGTDGVDTKGDVRSAQSSGLVEKAANPSQHRAVYATDIGMSLRHIVLGLYNLLVVLVFIVEIL